MTSPSVAGSGRQSIYTGRTTSWTMVAATCIGAFLIVIMAKDSEGAWSTLTVPFVLVAIGTVGNILTSSSVRVTAGPNGFTVRWGIVGWPRCHYRLDEIELAEVIDISWWRVSAGFWWTPKRTCHTVRKGPTVRLVLTNGRHVTITVPDPAAAVAAIQSAPGDPDPT